MCTWLALVLLLYCIASNFNNSILYIITEGSPFNQNCVLNSATGNMGSVLFLFFFAFLILFGVTLHILMYTAAVLSGLIWIVSQIPLWYSLQKFDEHILEGESRNGGIAQNHYSFDDETSIHLDDDFSSQEFKNKGTASVNDINQIETMVDKSSLTEGNGNESRIENLEDEKNTVKTPTLHKRTASNTSDISISDLTGNSSSPWTPRTKHANKRSCFWALRRVCKDRDLAFVLIAMFIYGDVIGTMSHNVIVFARANIGFSETTCIWYALINKLSCFITIISIIAAPNWRWPRMVPRKIDAELDANDDSCIEEIHVGNPITSMFSENGTPFNINDDNNNVSMQNSGEMSSNLDSHQKSSDMFERDDEDGDIGVCTAPPNTNIERFEKVRIVIDTSSPKSQSTVETQVIDSKGKMMSRQLAVHKMFRNLAPSKWTQGEMTTKFIFIFFNILAFICALICIIISNEQNSLSFQTIGYLLLQIFLGIVSTSMIVLSKSVLELMVPPSEAVLFFGIVSLLGRVSGVIGPLTFALAGYWFGGAREGYFVLAAEQFVAVLLLLCTNMPEHCDPVNDDESVMSIDLNNNKKDEKYLDDKTQL